MEEPMDLFTRLDEVRARWDVLGHPFYQRWSNGELSREELARYAGQYRHAVVALADASERAARLADGELAAGLVAHAAEERAHIALWDGFLAEMGGDAADAPEAETAACADTWAGVDRDLLGTLVALYAIEDAQPAISETKRDGLIAHYGVDEGPATAYFDLHARLDVEHAAQARAALEPRLAGADADRLVVEAEAVLRANWELLDGVERVAAAA
jgi:pyrroloquinoline-quinone synthase